MTPKGIIFDLNGTLLLDSPLHEQAWFQVAEQMFRHKLTLTEYHQHIHGRTNKTIITYLLQREPNPDELHHFQETKEEFYRQLCMALDSEFKLAPGVIPFLDSVKTHNIPATIATGSYWGNVAFYLEHLSLSQWFNPELIVFDNMVRPGKPAPDVFIEAASNLNLTPECCVVFEDSLSGIKSAKAAMIGKIITVEPSLSKSEVDSLGGVFLMENSFMDINLSKIGF